MTVLVLGSTAAPDAKLVGEITDVGVNGPYSIRYFLTPCCLTDATGVSWGTGIACRGCYAELDESYGRMPPAQLAETFGDGLPLEQYRTVVKVWAEALADNPFLTELNA